MDQYTFEGAGPAGPAGRPFSMFLREGALDQPKGRAPSQPDTKGPPGGSLWDSLWPPTSARQASGVKPHP